MHNPFTTKDPLLDIINQVVLGEKKLTDAEMKKREEIAQAMERDNPGMDMGKKMAIATAQAKKVAEEVELDEAATRKEVKKVYSKKGNHIGTVYHVDNGKDKPFISAHYHPGGFMNNSLSLKSHEDAEKWIHHSHSSHLEHAKARHDEAKMELRQHEKHLKSIPEEVELDEASEKVVSGDIQRARQDVDYHKRNLDSMQKKISRGDKEIEHGRWKQLRQSDAAKLQQQHKQADDELTKAHADVKKTAVSKFLQSRKGDGKVRTEEVEQIDEGASHEDVIAYADKKLKGWKKTVKHIPKPRRMEDGDPHSEYKYVHPKSGHTVQLHQLHANKKRTQVTLGKTDDIGDMYDHKDGTGGTKMPKNSNVKHHIDAAMERHNKHMKARGLKEDAEQIDEISKKTLGNYVAKAVVDVHNDARWAGETDDKDAKNKAFKRLLGVKSAASRLSQQVVPGGRINHFRRNNEEVEQIDEADAIYFGSRVAKKGIFGTKYGSAYPVTKIHHRVEWDNGKSSIHHGSELKPIKSTEKGYWDNKGGPPKNLKIKEEVNLDEHLENFWEAYTTMFNEAEDQQQNILLRAMAKDPSDLMKMKRAISMGDKALTNPALRQEILAMLDKMMHLTTGDPSLLQRTKAGFQKAKKLKMPEEVQLEEVEELDEADKDAPFEGGREVKSKKSAAERVKKIAKGMQKKYK